MINTLLWLVLVARRCVVNRSFWNACLLMSCPVVFPTAAARGFSIGSNFTTVTMTETANFFPPDAMGAVGPNHVVVLINGRYSVYDRLGNLQSSTSLDQFWVDGGVTPDGGFSFDPRILYDRQSSRFYATAVDNNAQPNNILLGVSQSSDPGDGWTSFKFDSDADDLQWADFPMLGMNGEAVVVSANMQTLGGPAEVHVLVLPKSDLLLPTPVVTDATLLENSASAFTPQPVVDLDHGTLPLPLLSGDMKQLGELLKDEVTGSVTAPAVTSFKRIRNNVSSGFAPPDIDQPGSKVDVDAGGTRFSGNVVLQNGSLWAVQGVDVAGRAAVEWYEIDTVNYDVLQNGLISDSSLGFNFPSIAVNDDEDVVIAFSGGDPNTFISSYAVVGSTNGTGLTAFGPVTQLHPGQAEYEHLDSIGRNRWGDYSATVIDPLDEYRFWTFQEFAFAADEWAIQVTEIIVPEPGNLISALVGMFLMGLFSQRKRTRIMKNNDMFDYH